MGVRAIRTGIVAVLAVVGVALAVSAPAFAEDPAAAIYSPNTVEVVYLTLPQASEEELASDPDEYVEGTFALAETDGSPSGVAPSSTPITVGIRLKGQLGSSRTLDQKAAFKVKFSFVKGQKFLGLKKMTLNNMVQDPSMIHERLAYEAFGSLGVQGSRTGYAYVYVNGVDFGMHLDIETLDDISLAKRFGEFDHLYEGSYGNDVETGPADEQSEIDQRAGEFEIDEGSEKNRDDLKALIELVNRPGGDDWSARVEPLADLKEMTRMWAIEKYIGHWDGYSGRKTSYQPNNYYLMSEPDGRFLMLPWGTDQTWDERLEFGGSAGVLFTRCLEDESCAEMYRRSLREMQAALAADDLDAHAAATAALLAPWQEMEMGNSRHEHGLAEIQSSVSGTRAFIAQRPAELSQWLATQPPEVPGSHLQISLEPASLVADGVSTTTATASLTDAEGDPIAGDEVVFSTDAGQAIGAVTDHDNGSYSVPITSTSSAGTARITATDLSVEGLSADATLTQTPGPAVSATLAIQPSTLPADGASRALATATVTDAFGNPVPGDEIAISSDGGQSLGPVADAGDGVYSASVTASSVGGVSIVSVRDLSVEPPISGSASLTQVAPAAGGVTLPAPMLLKTPSVTLRRKPPRRTHDRTPTFRFGSDSPTVTFACRLGRRAWRPCGSPLTLPRLGNGPHVLAITASSGGVSSLRPSTYRFVVEPR